MFISAMVTTAPDRTTPFLNRVTEDRDSTNIKPPGTQKTVDRTWELTPPPTPTEPLQKFNKGKYICMYVCESMYVCMYV